MKKRVFGLASVALGSFVSVSSSAGCGPTLSVGQAQGDGGTEAGAVEDGAPTSLTPAAAASPNFAKCKIACTPPSSGPCASEDANACINACTVMTDGLKLPCVQCIVEYSGYAGLACDPTRPTNPPQKFGPYGGAKSGGAGTLPPASTDDCGITEPPCTPPPKCGPADEKCDGFVLGKTTQSPCSTRCQ